MADDNQRARGRAPNDRQDQYKRRTGDSRGRPVDESSTDEYKRQNASARYRTHDQHRQPQYPPEPSYDYPSHEGAYGPAPSTYPMYEEYPSSYPPTQEYNQDLQLYERSRGRSSYGARERNAMPLDDSPYATHSSRHDRNGQRSHSRRRSPPEAYPETRVSPRDAYAGSSRHSSRSNNSPQEGSRHSSRSNHSPQEGSRHSSASGDGQPNYQRPISPMDSYPAAPHDLARKNGGASRRQQSNSTVQKRKERRPLHDLVVSRNLEQNKVGTKGETIYLKANYFKVETAFEWTILHYHVSFEPDTGETRDRKRIFYEIRKQLPGCVFNGTSLYTQHVLQEDQLTSIRKEEDGRETTIRIKLVAVVEPTDIQFLHILGIVIRKCMEGLKFQLMGRNYYNVKALQEIRNLGISIIPGYQSSIRRHQQDILLGADVSSRVLRSDTAYDIMYRTNLKDYKEYSEKQLLGATVMTTYNDCTYRVLEIDWDKNPMSTFETKNGEITFLEYYSKKRIDIKERGQALLVAKPKGGDRRSKQNERVLLIPELCFLTGISDEMRQNRNKMQTLAQTTSPLPRQRIAKLMDFNRKMQEAAPTAILKEWGMSLDRNMVELKGRVLPTPSILYGDSTGTADNNWSKQITATTMCAPAGLKHWHIICSERQKHCAGDLVSSMVRAVRRMGMEIHPPKYLLVRQDDAQAICASLVQAKHEDSQLALVLVGSNRADLYATIKIKSFVQKPLLTQVVTMKVASKQNLSVSTKIATQLCCKIGGVPWVNKFPPGLMVVGFDISRDAKEKSKAYGALVACINLREGKYFSIVKKQEVEVETAESLDLNMVAAVRAYQEVNGGKLPDRICFYRDGVGDGQLALVNSVEVETVVQKLQKIYNDMGETLKFGFIVVTKRINTRLFTMRDENPPPGTVVDQTITLPERHDFYLITQSSRVTTVSPTAYNLLVNTLGVRTDDIQNVTYKLCHMYYNWVGAIRVPHVCQLAKKLSFMCGQFLHQVPHSELSGRLYYL